MSTLAAVVAASHQKEDQLSYLVQCKGCDSAVTIESAADPDAALSCGCCPEDHHHGQAANETGTPCRPITIIATGPSAELTSTTGGN